MENLKNFDSIFVNVPLGAMIFSLLHFTRFNAFTLDLGIFHFGSKNLFTIKNN